MLAPFRTMSGARSPPMASRAMMTRSLTRAEPTRDGLRRLRCRRHHFATVVVAAGGAHVVRPLDLAAVRALDVPHGFQRVMRAPHVATRFRRFLLRDCHGTNSQSAPAGRKPQLSSQKQARWQPQCLIARRWLPYDYLFFFHLTRAANGETRP